MLFRVRASLRDRPGALAALTASCGEAGLNILGLQIFPELGTVTDELVLSAPESWTAREVAELVGGAGGDEVSVEPCTTHDLIDQPTRWLGAASEVAAGADVADVLTRLLGEHRERWSATEQVRAAALDSLARRLADEATGPGAGADTRGPVQYAEGESGVEAWIGRHVVGRAQLRGEEEQELQIEVDPSWRRLGIGTTLLHRACGLAARRGAREVVLRAAAGDEGFVTMVCGAGTRALLKMHDGVLSARIPVGPRVPGDGRARPGRPVPTR